MAEPAEEEAGSVIVSFADPVTRRKPPKATPVGPCAICERPLTADPARSYRSDFTGRWFCSPAIGHLKRRKAVKP